MLKDAFLLTIFSAFFLSSFSCSENAVTGTEAESTINKIAFVSERDRNKEIYIMNADGTEQINITNHEANEENPSWSPDGNSIVFTSDRTGYAQIYVMDSNGENVKRLTSNSSVDVSPSWSPDGTRIVFVSGRNNAEEIYLMNADGSDQTRITFNNYPSRTPSWSPDGTQIMYVGFPGIHANTAQIFIKDLASEIEVNIPDEINLINKPTWSPSGDRIVFSKYFDLFLMDPDGSNEFRLTTTISSVWNVEASWSPDEKHIVYTSKDDVTRDIYIVSTDGTQQSRLTITKKDYAPAWSATKK